MIECLETYLIDLMKNFNEFGIPNADGKPFEPQKFDANRYNTETPPNPYWFSSLKEFDLSEVIKQRQDSHQPFFDPHCDGIKENAALREIIITSDTKWIDASTDQHRYPTVVGKAMWNHALHSLQTMMSNPVSTLYYKQFHEQFMSEHAAYMDDRPVTSAAAQALKIRFSAIPRVVDARTLAFAKSCLKFITPIAADPDPLADLKAMYPNAPQYIHDEIDKRKAKTIVGFQYARSELIDRIGRYQARLTINKPKPEAQQTLAIARDRLKKCTTDAIAPTQAFFEAASRLERECANFNRKNPAPESAEKIIFYETQLEKIEQLNSNAPSINTIEQELERIQQALVTTLPAELNKIAEDQPLFLFTEDYPYAIYKDNKPAEEVIIHVNRELAEHYEQVIATLHQHEKNLPETIILLKHTRNDLQTRLEETKHQGSILKLVQDKNNAQLLCQQLIEANTNLAQQKRDRLNEQERLITEIDSIQSISSPLFEASKKLDDSTYSVENTLLKAIQSALNWSDTELAQWQVKIKDKPKNEKTWGESLTEWGSTVTAGTFFKTPREELTSIIEQKLIFLVDEARNKQAALKKTGINITSLDKNIAATEQEILQQQHIISNTTQEFETKIAECTQALENTTTEFHVKLENIAADAPNINDYANLVESTNKKINAIKKEYDDLKTAGEKPFNSERLTSLLNAFDTQYSLYTLTQAPLLIALEGMTKALQAQYQPDITEKDPDFSKNQEIVGLAQATRKATLCLLDKNASLEEKRQAATVAETYCSQKLHSNHLKIIAGAVLGAIAAVLAVAGIIAGLATIFATGGLGLLVAAPFIAKVGAAAGASSIALFGGAAGSALGEIFDEKSSGAFYEQLRFFSEPFLQALTLPTINPHQQIAPEAPDLSENINAVPLKSF